MSDRITNIDAIRGFALFGILVVNILAFSSVGYGSGLPSPDSSSTLDTVLSFVISLFFELKFYLLFSFLFGYSVTLQMSSAQTAGASFVPRMVRRQIGLLLIGVMHAVLLYHGDILTTYALLGLVLLTFRGRSDRTCLRTAAGLIVATGAICLALACLFWLVPEIQDPEFMTAELTATREAFRGGFADVITARLNELVFVIPALLLLQAPCALAMFLVGLVAGRRKLLSTPALYQPFLRPALMLGLLVGLPGSLFYSVATTFAKGTALEIVGLVSSILTGPFLTMAILAALLQLFAWKPAEMLRNYLADAGRMALSNYLLQSLICSFVFYGYGLGLIDQLATVWSLAIAVVIFVTQVMFSHLWQKHFRYGPVEWLLRALTIGRLPDWKRVQTVV